METLLAVVSGVLIFVIGQVAIHVWLEPLQSLKACIVEISEALTKYEGAIISLAVAPTAVRETISREVATLSARLSGRRELIPCYSAVRVMYALPSQENIQEAIGALNSLSNYATSSHTNASVISSYNRQEACDALGLYVAPSKRLDPSLKIQFVTQAQQTVQPDGPASGGSAG